ncbi:Cytochrome b6-f complex subunit 7 [Rhynchospora pubera]|uniref:Cytochrome b6-f complex subunit 7 n=1 Tax=Rhynchospora pubera TaxID=906938 RepID=A0AAV8BPY4_9POAL|nr:Cytochrome b6-f complex subunit 7 [Rhynchospora pubera]
MASMALPASGCGLRLAPGRSTSSKVVYVNKFSSLSRPISNAQRFTMAVQNSLKLGKKTGGGALSAQCNAAGEIFQIAAIINGLVLVGVAVGFVLLRVEASLEESD